MLKRIGVEVFHGCNLSEIDLPDAVDEIGDKCFCECRRLSRVRFGELSSLKSIGIEVFPASHLEEIVIPESLLGLLERAAPGVRIGHEDWITLNIL